MQPFCLRWGPVWFRHIAILFLMRILVWILTMDVMWHTWYACHFKITTIDMWPLKWIVPCTKKLKNTYITTSFKWTRIYQDISNRYLFRYFTNKHKPLPVVVSVLAVVVAVVVVVTLIGWASCLLYAPSGRNSQCRCYPTSLLPSRPEGC